MPVLALLAYPITALFGPLAAYDALMVAAPACAALSAYALCLHLCRKPGAALVGGWVFGFSSYTAAHINEHLNLEWTALLPLLVLVALRRMQGQGKRRGTVVALALLLAAQAGIAIELLATSCLMAALAWLLAWWRLPDWRKRLWLLAQDVMLAAPLTLLLLAPLLWAMFGRPHDLALPKMWPEFFSIDPLNFFFPTFTTWLGGHAFMPLTSYFGGTWGEQTGYLGLPMMFIVWRYLRRASGFARWVFLCTMLLSLGPVLVIHSSPTFLILPWRIMLSLPLLNKALPARMMVYAFLLAGLFTALWLAGTTSRWRWLAAGLAVMWLWPAPAPVEAIPVQRFFNKTEIMQYLGPDRRVLVLPWGIKSPSMYWQVTSGFSYSQVGGYLVFPPARVQADGVLMKLFFDMIGPDTLADLKAYALASGVQDVIVVPGTDPRLAAGIAGWGWPARQVDGVSLYTAPSPNPQ
ncbi:hypothetical protein MXAZACID_05401 [Acidocella sp. MX-AZ02]|nr:hypothetical protein MXAZACID_05401 [Acidocella sp. MX-AZ02]